MPQTKKNAHLRREICIRIKEFSEEYLLLGSRELSDALGYADPSTMRAVWKTKSLPSVEKIAELSRLKTKDGSYLNLNWLFTGEGDICTSSISKRSVEEKPPSVEKKLFNTLRKMPIQKQRSLLNIIS